MTLTSVEAAMSGLAVAAAVFVLIWLGSLIRRDASLVDRFWGVGFVVLDAWYGWTGPSVVGGGRWLVLAMVALWGLRLSAYLTWRNWGKGEDYRYQEMRARNPDGFWLSSLVTVHLLQAAILWVVGLPLLVAIRTPPAVTEPLGWLGVVLWAVGLFFEARGDWELSRFRANPANRGRVLDTGVWRYTRHPNYFGDACVWWGFFAVAAASGGYWTAVGPVVMTVLLLRISGVALLEKKLVETRPGYREYVERTSGFVPWPPRE